MLHGMSRFARRSVMLAALAVSTAAVVSAQATGTGSVRGRVIEAGTDRPVADAQVIVDVPGGGSRGGVTDGNGNYSITSVPAGTHNIRVRRIGFTPGTRSITVSSGQTVTVDMTVAAAATQLSALVVTGTSEATAKRAIGNAVSQVNVAELTERTTITTVAEALQSKTTGVSILPGSGVPGTSSEIRIRGAASLSGYRPVVYIDGIRFNDASLGNFNATGSGLAGQAQSSQSTSALDFINPEDIESIEVIKGPAAATLYGADAAGGVIQIITKKGKLGQQPLRWSTKLERGRTDWGMATPVAYTTCDSIKIADTATWPGCTGVTRGTVLTSDPLRTDPNALRTGDQQKVSVSVRGGGDKFSFFLSGDRDTEEGVFFNSYNYRKAGRANFTVLPSDKSDFTVNMAYMQSNLRLPYQDESANSLLLSAARSKPGRISVVGPPWSTVNPINSNRYNNQTKSDRMTISTSFHYRPKEWFRNRFTAGIDYTSSLAALLALPGAIEDPAGFTAQRVPRTRLYTIDYAGNVTRNFLSNFVSTSSFGMQAIANRTERLDATGSGLGAPDVTLIGTAQTTSGANSFSENNSVGVFGQQQVAWKDRLFVTVALRADDNSSFGQNFDAILFPKASVSWVLSEEPMVADFFNTIRTTSFRFRSAWGQAGRAPAPYSATQTYTVDKVTLGTSTSSALRTSAFGNPDLRPETGTEIEVGFDVGFFEDRISSEFTYYSKKMTDMLVSLATPGSLGFGGAGRLRNLGAVTNKGIELGLNLIPVQTRPLTWEGRLNLTTNNNKLLTFGDTVKDRTGESLPSQAYGAVQQHRKGYPLGGYWAQFAARNPDGTPRLTAANAVIMDTAFRFIGPSSPTREIGISNTFTIFKNFRIYALLDYKAGHYIFNLKERNRCQTANDNCLRANTSLARRVPQTAADSVLWKELLVWRTVAAEFVEKADFMKLRDLSFSYTLPSSIIQRAGVQTGYVTFAGHNLALWTDYSGLDPEVNTYGGRNFNRVDAYAAPMMRRWSLSMNLTF